MDDILQKSKADFFMRVMQGNFTEEIKPRVTGRLGGGLAAVVSKKLAESRSKYLHELSDDSDFYDDESDTSEKKRFPDLVSQAKDDYYDEEFEDSNAT